MLNHITVQGRLCKDVELRRLDSGKACASVTLACDRDFANKATNEKETDFIDIVAFGGTAEHLAKWFAKGKMVIVSGRLQIRSWTDKDGNKRRNAEVVANSVYFGESKKADGGSVGGSNSYAGDYPETMAMIGQYTAQNAEQDAFALLDDDDGMLPFN